MAASSSALDSVYVDMMRYLNVPNLRPYLRQQHMLTEDEFEMLNITPGNTTQQAVENLIKILKRKGPSHEHQFLAVLKLSMEKDPHQGHASIIQALEDRLAQIQSGYNSEEMESDGILLPGESTNSVPYQQTYKDSPIVPLQLQHMPIQHQKHTLELVGNDEHFTDPKRAALRCKVIQANESIIMKFASLVLGIFRLLKQKQVPVEEVRMSLLFLGCLRDRSKEENIKIFGPTSDVAHANSLQSLIECLHSYSSWYNYGLLKFAAIEFGKEDGKQLIGDYENELAHYFETIVAYQCPHFSLTTGIPMGFDQLIVKVEWDYMSRKVQDIAVFQSKLSSLLKLEPEVFILKSVEDGCMQFTWAIPASIVEYVLTMVICLTDVLAQEDVTLVYVGGKELNFNTKPIVPEGTDVEAQYGVQVVSSNKQQPYVIPVRETLSNESFLSSLSELTSKSSTSEIGDCETVLDKRLSNNSSLMGIERNSLTAEEVDILSIYSGAGSLDLNTSNAYTIPSNPVSTTNSPSPRSKTPIQAAVQPPNDIKESLQISHPFFSESDLLVHTNDSALSSNNVRAQSLPNCSSTESGSGAVHKSSRIARAKKFLKQLLHSRHTDTASQNSSVCSPSMESDVPPKLYLLNLTTEPSSSSGGQCSFHYYYYTEEEDPQTISSDTSPAKQPHTPQSKPHRTIPASSKHASPYTSTIHSTAQFRPPSPILLGKDYTSSSPQKESYECDLITTLDNNSPILPRIRSNSAPRKLLQSQLHAIPTILPEEELSRGRGNSLTVPTSVCPRSISYYTTLYRHIADRVASPVSESSSGYVSQNDFDSVMSGITSQESLYQIPSRTSSLKYRNFKVYSTQLSNSRSAFGSLAERHSFH